jgi:hypothetical protein
MIMEDIQCPTFTLDIAHGLMDDITHCILACLNLNAPFSKHIMLIFLKYCT